MTTINRDRDKSAVYYAESVVFDNTLFDSPLHSDDFIALANSLFAHDWWERHGIPIPIIEPTTSKDTTSYALTQCDNPHIDPIIRIAPCHITAHTIAHEASHIAQYHFYNPSSYGPVESHGREFRATYLSVVEIVLGEKAAHDLRVKFTEFVKVRPESAPGLPGSVMCVPRPKRECDPSGMGLYQMMRLRQDVEEIRKLHTAPRTPRLNGAIAL